MGRDAFRLAMCDLAPYAVWTPDGGARGAWLGPLRAVLASLNVTSAAVAPPGAGDCGPRSLLAMLRASQADAAVYPFLARARGDLGNGTRTAYPIDVGAPVFVSAATTPAPNVIVDPLTPGAWLLFAAIAAGMVAAEVVVDRRARRPRPVLRALTAALTGDVQLRGGSPLELCVLKAWASAFSLLFLAVYTALMASIMLEETVERQTMQDALADGKRVAVTPNLRPQLRVGRSALSRLVTTRYRAVRVERALANLPVLTSGPMAAWMRQHSCGALDLSYNELAHAPVSVALRAGAAPAGFDGALMRAVQRGAFDGAVKAFLRGEPPNCPPQPPEMSFSPDVATLSPVLAFGAAAVAAVWLARGAELLAARRRRRRRGRSAPPRAVTSRP